MNKRNRGRLKLVGIFLLFAIPISSSYLLYYGLDAFGYGAATNKGELLTPAQPLPELQLRGEAGATTSTDVLAKHWTILQVAPDGCRSNCLRSLKETRQVWLLLHDERERVRRVLLVGGQRLPQLPKFPSVDIYNGDLGALWSLLQQHGADRAGTVYLIDPLGNWVLYYPPEQDGTELYKDAKHLLRLSHIG